MAGEEGRQGGEEKQSKANESVVMGGDCRTRKKRKGTIN